MPIGPRIVKHIDLSLMVLSIGKHSALRMLGCVPEYTLAAFWLFYARTVLQNDGLPCFSIHFGNFLPEISAKRIARTACPGFLPSSPDERLKNRPLSGISPQNREYHRAVSVIGGFWEQQS